jgi:hypothetical protein
MVGQVLAPYADDELDFLGNVTPIRDKASA